MTEAPEAGATPRRPSALGDLRSLSEALPERLTSPSGRRFSWSKLAARMVIGGSSSDVDAWQGDLNKLPANFFQLACETASGKATSFSEYFGDVCLVVNVASF